MGDRYSGLVHRVAPGLPGLSLKKLAIASEDASTIYKFDEEGRHLRTVDALTGKDLYQFGYVNGLPASVTDPDGRVTTIHRENGKLASIEGPFGHVTTFELFNSGTHKGYIKTIASPAGIVQLEYASESYKEGLLTKLIDPKGMSFPLSMGQRVSGLA